MIQRPPRSAAELSPRLRAIAEYAVDQFDEPEVRPIIRPETVRRFAIPLVLVLLAIATKFGLDTWTTRLTTPSPHAIKAAEFLAKARECEEVAIEYRAIAATGKPRARMFGDASCPLRLAPRFATLADQKAAGFRKLAYIEECQNQGFPVP